MTVAIHQPDFMPWLGFFLKMKKADTLIVLDHTENNPRDAASWLRRVKIAVNKEPTWFSIPLQKIEGKIGVPINELQISKPQVVNFAEKNLKIIQQNYGGTPQYKTVFPLIEAYFSMKSYSLCEQNMFFINEVKKQIGISTQLIYSSSLDPQHKSTEMLIDILQKTKASTYLCGDGAAGYMNVALFEKAKIDIRYNRFSPPQYPQSNTKDFIGGLSIIDTLMNIGFDGVAELLDNLSKQTIN
jgi:hypothetical protein